MEDNQTIRVKIITKCKKYPSGSKKEDIDSGKVKPYKEVKKEMIVYADDRWLQKLNRNNGSR